jgi:hypothetical protein
LSPRSSATITLISIKAPSGSPSTATVERAGLWPSKAASKSGLILEKSAMDARKTVAFTTSLIFRPTYSSNARTFASTSFACPSTSWATIFSAVGSIGIWSEHNRKIALLHGLRIRPDRSGHVGCVVDELPQRGGGFALRHRVIGRGIGGGFENEGFRLHDDDALMFAMMVKGTLAADGGELGPAACGRASRGSG